MGDRKHSPDDGATTEDAFRCWRKADPVRFATSINFAQLPRHIADKIATEEAALKARYLLKHSPAYRAFFDRHMPDHCGDTADAEDCSRAAASFVSSNRYTRLPGQRETEERLVRMGTSLDEESGANEQTEKTLKELLGEKELAQSTMKSLEWAMAFYENSDPLISDSLAKCHGLIQERGRHIRHELLEKMPDVLADLTEGY